eukprot:CAMPEP_0174361742 /NCGR_PEP_ID=MMETSP0811_2-20130205/60667_1 /TAXON_ID=73025 ORGANISM="Eutreptiella gymnastica-like, Strain CCMP1594" /NCGR_SAMPLE_ID=MMETSP0811_2 /ASSEMBLY_ACC=CAM_ASM_000667 /LENGTH=46 /DNA_ID= /DNA_START= /DNA_END= /DNA_ORIENTATION=
MCPSQPTAFCAPRGHWAAYRRGSLALHHLVPDSAHPYYISDPLPQS